MPPKIQRHGGSSKSSQDSTDIDVKQLMMPQANQSQKKMTTKWKSKTAATTIFNH
jgi:hypothetical protein